MTFSVFSSVVLGLVLTYALLSLIATWVQELLTGLFATRGRTLVKGIGALLQRERSLGRLLSDIRSTTVKKDGKHPECANLVGAVFGHPVIQRLGHGRRLPSYIAGSDFARAVVDVVSRPQESAERVEDAIEAFSAGVEEITAEGTWSRDALTAIAKGAQGMTSKTKSGMSALLSEVERWYDGVMERATGWYKRRAQLIALAIGFALAIAMNADSIKITVAVSSSASLQTAVRANGELVANESDAVDVSEVVAELRDAKFPIGWGGQNAPDWKGVPLALLGWLVTAVAVSQGSALWFALLKKIIRSSGNVTLQTILGGATGTGQVP